MAIATSCLINGVSVPAAHTSSRNEEKENEKKRERNVKGKDEGHCLSQESKTIEQVKRCKSSESVDHE